MRNIKLLIEYDGTNYSGWQRQNNAKSIQGTIENSICKITGEKVNIIGASRTDAGVHAKGYVANFLTDSKIPGEKFSGALNSKLPKDIVILKSEEVDINFHSRYCSQGKTYCYTIVNRKENLAIGRNYMYHYKYDLNIDKMKKAAEFFVGTHDFSAFRNLGSSVKTTTRTISSISIERQEDIIKIYASADGFLYNMMRIIVGVLIQVGDNKLAPEKVPNIILSKDRKRAGKAAPAEGLCLVQVNY